MRAAVSQLGPGAAVGAVGISLAQSFLADSGESGRPLWHRDGRRAGSVPNHSDWMDGWQLSGLMG